MTDVIPARADVHIAIGVLLARHGSSTEGARTALLQAAETHRLSLFRLSRALIGIATHDRPDVLASRADDAARLLWDGPATVPALDSGPPTWMT